MKLGVFGLAVMASCAACSTPPPAPAAAPDPRIARVDALFAEYDRADSPGCALGIIENGRIVHARGFGSANLELGVANSPDTVFDIGSTSKQFTAACVALLAQDGKLALDDDVRKYVGELPDLGHVITLRHLLNHTSGIRDYLELFALAGIETEDYTTKEQALAMLARQRALNFVPGTEFLYSNSGYFLLSIVVERVSGKTLPEFAHERLFVPLGMRDTHVHDDHTRIVPRRAQGYARLADGRFGIAMSDFEQTGDGAVMTTVEDLARWDANFQDPRVGGRALLDMLQTKAVLAGGRELEYALGLMLSRYRGLPTVAHGGAWAGYRAELLRFPEQHVSIACLCNLAQMNPSQSCRRVADVWLEGVLAPAEAPQSRPAAERGHSAQDASRDALPDAGVALENGCYECAELGVQYEISGAGADRRIGLLGRATTALVPVSADTCGADGLVVRVSRDDHGAIRGFTLDSGRVRGVFFALRR